MSRGFSFGKLSGWATFVATLAVVLAVAASPASAKMSTTVKVVKKGSGKSLSIHGGGSGSGHTIDVRPGPNNDYVISDIASDVLKPSGGCTFTFAGSNRVTCPKAGVTGLMIITGSTPDYIYTRDVSLPGAVTSGSGDDTIELSSQSDIPTGDQFVKAGNGADHITTGNGKDKIYAGKNDDRIDGGDGEDLLVADDGNDEIDAVDSPGHAARDTVICGTGLTDTAYVDGSIDDQGVINLLDDVRTNSGCETLFPIEF